jgi:hypothetical protein
MKPSSTAPLNITHTFYPYSNAHRHSHTSDKQQNLSSVHLADNLEHLSRYYAQQKRLLARGDPKPFRENDVNTEEAGKITY